MDFNSPKKINSTIKNLSITKKNYVQIKSFISIRFSFSGGYWGNGYSIVKLVEPRKGSSKKGGCIYTYLHNAVILYYP